MNVVLTPNLKSTTHQVKYDTYTQLLTELETIDLEKTLIIDLSFLEKFHVSPYIMHVLRPFLARNKKQKVTLMVSDDDIRIKWIELAEKALRLNFVRYDEKKSLLAFGYDASKRK